MLLDYKGKKCMQYFPEDGSSEFLKNINNKKAVHTHTHKYPLQIEQTQSFWAISFLLNGKYEINGHSCWKTFFICEVDLICSKSFNFKGLRTGKKKS